MARRRPLLVPSWLRHRNLLTTEAVLVVAVGMELLQRWVAGCTTVPWWGKTMMVMVVNAGVLGGLLILLTGFTRRSLSGAHRAVQAVPLPTPLLVIHLVVLVGLFSLYAWVWGYAPASLTQ